MAGNEHLPESEQALNDGLRLQRRQEGARVAVDLAGDLDMYACSRLMEVLQQSLDQPIKELEVNAADLDFIDSAGLRTILWARAEAQSKGIEFQVTAVSRVVERVIDLAGLREILLSPAA